MGAKIQCVKVGRVVGDTSHADIQHQGKCTRAYHVTCAMESPEVDFEEVEVQEWVCKKDLAQSENPTNTVAQTSDTDVPTDSTGTGAQSNPGSQLASDIAEKQYTLVKIVHTKLFCPLHNTVSLTLPRTTDVD